MTYWLDKDLDFITSHSGCFIKLLGIYILAISRSFFVVVKFVRERPLVMARAGKKIKMVCFWNECFEWKQLEAISSNKTPQKSVQISLHW